ncbi:hypothetical protein AKJ65_02735 [candidate division MSBL1 archaeon SCGC-AAA259E19]|uniref:Molybdopterin dinucleotide-binding domain-containing protein n=1 Tax=candidate division MSBL1 archaeon SCGC-AAA259E19 TaxID=1698264 RepID=A0A133ULQ6_9EURY|nr:hypothetical protein AKJ65_02735 [candidate division MSBL1 archaeon SCGC-AAA259E19]
MNFCLITGRTSKQGEAREIGKTTQEYQNNTAVVYLSEGDMKELGLEESSPVELSTRFGSVTALTKKDEGLDRGIIFMPIGPWASKLIGGDTKGTGSSHAKGLPARLSATDEDVQSLEKILAEG